MGYAWRGVCYDTTADALNAFAIDVPSIDGWGINTLLSAPTINATGQISYSIRNQPITGTATAKSTNSTLQLPSCTSDSLATLELQDMALVIGLVICFLVGFRMGQAA